MHIVQEFNGLNGEMVTRDRLKTMAENAVYLEQKAIAERLKRAAEGLDDDQEVRVNIDRTAFEEIPDYILNNLPFNVPQDEKYNGLAKAVSADEIYQYITDLMVNTIKKVGHLPWQMEWEKTSMYNGHQAINYDSKKGYRGINFFLTNFEVKEIDGELVAVPRDLSNPYFLTFNQIEKHGGKLKKGSKGVRVVYFTRLWYFEGKDSKGEKIEFGSYDKKKLRAWLVKNRGNIPAIKTDKDLEKYANSYIPILKYYNIFHGADVEGIKWGDLPKNENVDKPERERIDIAEAIVNAMPKPPKIEYKGDQPVYRPGFDMVQMTPIEAFNNEQSYYSTLFHELVHSTGHKSRLDRFKDYSTFSKKDYAFEELVAEMGAVFLCSEAGILFSTIDNSAKYLSSWSKRLIDHMEEDNRFFFRASSRSQAAADYMLDRDQEEKPAYIKKMVASTKKEIKKPVKKKAKKKVQTGQLELGLVGTIPAFKDEEKAKKFILDCAKKNGLNIAVNLRKTEKLPSVAIVGGDVNKAKKGAIKKPLSPKIDPKEPIKKRSKKVSCCNVVSKDNKKTNTNKKPVKKQSKLPKNDQKGLKNPLPELEAKPEPVKAIPDGFVVASEGVKEKAETFRLKGELGKFLGDLQRFRLAILLQGDPHAGKSEVCAQLANGFLDIGMSGGYFDLEQGGLVSKDTQGAFNRNISAENQKKLAVTGEAPEGIETVRQYAEKFDFIVIDSFQELDAPVTAFNDLRQDFPNTIWIIIFQQNGKGGVRGGIKSAYDTPVRLKVYRVDDTFVNNYAEVEKNRGNRIGLQYNVSQKKVMNDDEPEKEKPAELPTGRLIIYE